MMFSGMFGWFKDAVDAVEEWKKPNAPKWEHKRNRNGWRQVSPSLEGRRRRRRAMTAASRRANR